MQDHIYVKGARENNLKNVDVTIPRDKLVVLTGLSGSGKSSLAFDTIYAEGQRRYVESLSSYARMFLGQMEKPDVDYIDGLSPAISIDQKTTSKNPRSTVGTVTEIHPGPEQAEIVIDLGDGAHGGAGILAGGLLVDGDGGGEAVDVVLSLIHI